MKPSLHSFFELLHRALESSFGIVVSGDDRARAKFYEARKESPELARVSITPSPINPGELWLVKTAETQDASLEQRPDSPLDLSL